MVYVKTHKIQTLYSLPWKINFARRDYANLLAIISYFAYNLLFFLIAFISSSSTLRVAGMLDEGKLQLLYGVSNGMKCLNVKN